MNIDLAAYTIRQLRSIKKDLFEMCQEVLTEHNKILALNVDLFFIIQYIDPAHPRAGLTVRIGNQMLERKPAGRPVMGYMQYAQSYLKGVVGVFVFQTATLMLYIAAPGTDPKKQQRGHTQQLLDDKEGKLGTLVILCLLMGSDGVQSASAMPVEVDENGKISFDREIGLSVAAFPEEQIPVIKS